MELKSRISSIEFLGLTSRSTLIRESYTILILVSRYSKNRKSFFAMDFIVMLARLGRRVILRKR